jgi:hypothetical protein
MSEVWNVLVGTGYVEDSSNGWIWFNYQAPTKNMTPEDVWSNLRQVFIDYYDEEHSRKEVATRENHPCEVTLDASMAFCPKCGARVTLQERDEDRMEGIAENVRDLMYYQCVEVDQNLVGLLEDRGWQIWGRPTSGPLVMFPSFNDWISGRLWNGKPDISSYKIQVKA